ncbi:TMEM164-related integral membrane acyltransferase [Oceanivirga miroungae]|uniref:Integral membrane protein n=1 Tax=Oceanivirga miroungae TaxID=1130046 RepID=A0A6I8MEF8_9FUSO|nr:TIGR02206 family membrane protein [Oceanivirga miroungae]VWL85472.1 hypothetical protein OMES3154_00757 [Oceanivirga miroungae]
MYKFTYFNNVHIKTILFCLIVGLIMIALPFFVKGLEKTRYTVYLGYLIILVKIADSIYRYVYENESIIETMPLNLCNIAVLIAGVYFITKKNILINIVYFFSLGAVLAILLPGIGSYNTKMYPYFFMAAHMMELIALVYAFIWLNAKITKKGLITSITLYLVLSVLVKIFDNLTGMNFMYLNDYIIPFMSVIKPIILYDVVLISLFVLSMIIAYLPFRNRKK